MPAPTSRDCRRARRSSTTTSSSTGRRCGPRTRRSRSSASATCAPTRPSPSTAASRCSSSTWTRRASTSARSRTSRGKADFAEVFFTDVIVPRENLVGPLHGGWAITQGSLAHERAGLWVEGVSRFEQTVDALVDLARRTGRSNDPVVRRKIAQTYELASSLRSLGYQGFASFAQGSSAPEHSYMKMATSEAGKAAYELGMEISGPYGAVTDDDARRGIRPLGDELLRHVRQHDRGRLVRDPAQHHRPAGAGPPSSLTPRPDLMDFTLTDDQQLLRDTARKLLDKECPPALVRARTSTIPPRTSRSGSTSASTPRSASVPRRTRASSSRRPARSRPPDRSSRRLRCSRRSRARKQPAPSPSRARAVSGRRTTTP